jgi:2-polyprenyl-6-methoxyphenol hydroxylase-like FAD-dependent oxidoreductase
MTDQENDVIIIGGGIGGLTLALALHKANVRCRIVEATPKLRPLGVGLNLLPHAMRDLSALGLESALASKGVKTQEYCFFTRNGQLVHREPRGLFAGYQWPQISIHRGDFHFALQEMVVQRLGPAAMTLGYKCVGMEQDAESAIVHFQDPATGAALPSVRGSVAVACDGVHSVARVQMHPKEAVSRYEGTMQYRGVTRWKPFLSGATMVYLGTHEAGKIIIYPIRNNVDAEGRQLVNWAIEVTRPMSHLLRDWNRRSRVEEFIGDFAGCAFEWLDIPAMLRAADVVYEYPMIDQEPLPFWTVGRITLLGDAAHPMMPRGSNGAAQAIIDATALAQLLSANPDPKSALREYESMRLPATANIVLANREIAPDAILRVVEDRTKGKPFDNIDDVISKEELAQWQARYKKVAGFAFEDLGIGRNSNR